MTEEQKIEGQSETAAETPAADVQTEEPVKLALTEARVREIAGEVAEMMVRNIRDEIEQTLSAAREKFIADAIEAMPISHTQVIHEPAAIAVSNAMPAEDFLTGDKVKSPAGTIVNIHDGAHLADIRLEDGTLTTIPLAGLELDE